MSETYSSAEEMPIKMTSSQILLKTASGKHNDFNQTNEQSLYGLISRHAVN